MNRTRSAFQIVITIVTVIAVIFGAYIGIWWLNRDVVNREAEIRRDQYEVQETARDEVLRQAAQIEAVDVQLTNPTMTDDQKATLNGQRAAMVTQLCNVASSISGGVTAPVSDAVQRYCGYTP
ncbi:MAG: hypothetical protein COT89_01095 [Candidatus Colwellbacteria bacterium CG10_big_fil_rev_8_21_14_0_10_42_22]|uniref:Uncharacterized protein n=1 Tax=Candidatus Colwellbacteria bacterium CG10_big_fil_rev_8_21_14_0_10_42_22 TaxID=1974540 RepID=A0A2H0VGB8_9BACT|nr:MAG: hypothetical protein COT89_01095 [Candidatus Colwellbacteria bacterium CG10_big_fil_rev_8_21_14_0_10_42_22]